MFAGMGTRSCGTRGRVHYFQTGFEVSRLLIGDASSHFSSYVVCFILIPILNNLGNDLETTRKYKYKLVVIMFSFFFFCEREKSRNKADYRKKFPLNYSCSKD